MPPSNMSCLEGNELRYWYFKTLAFKAQFYYAQGTAGEKTRIAGPRVMLDFWNWVIP